VIYRYRPPSSFANMATKYVFELPC
jgi:hypothetical protein